MSLYVGKNWEAKYLGPMMKKAEQSFVCVRYGINYAQKQRLCGKKHHSFVAYSLADRMRSSKKKKVKVVYLNSGAPS